MNAVAGRGVSIALACRAFQLLGDVNITCQPVDQRDLLSLQPRFE